MSSLKALLFLLPAVALAAPLADMHVAESETMEWHYPEAQGVDHYQETPALKKRQAAFIVKEPQLCMGNVRCG